MSFTPTRKERNPELEKAKREVRKLKEKQICLWMDAEKYKKLKLAAVEKNMSIKELICKAVDNLQL